MIIRLLLIVLYIAMLVGIVGGFWWARSWAEETYGNAQAQGEWQEWVDKANVQSNFILAKRRML